MGRPSAGNRILGPYRRTVGGKEIFFNIIWSNGERSDRRYESEEEAETGKKELEREIVRDDLTLEAAIEAYAASKRLDGNKENGITTSGFRLKMFFGDLELILKRLTANKCEALYQALAEDENVSVDTHRNALQETKRFLKWCVKVKKWLPANPAAEIDGRGKRSRGKTQHYVDEARTFAKYALACADKGDRGSMAALCALFTTLRATEIIRLQVRDLDDNGRIFQIAQSKVEERGRGKKRKTDAGKTPAAKRKVKVPAVLAIRLRKFVEGREPTEYLWGHLYDRRWPNKMTQRLCKDAGVPIITAHGLRGTLATLASEVGMAGDAIALAFGHEDESTTNKHYIQSNAAAERVLAQGLEVLLEGFVIPEEETDASAPEEAPAPAPRPPAPEPELPPARVIPQRIPMRLRPPKPN